MPRKILISITLACYLLLGIFVPFAHAQGAEPWYNQTFNQWHDKVFDKSNATEIFGERYTYAQVTWIVHSLTAIIMGSGLAECIGSGADVEGLRTCLEQNADNPLGASPIMSIAQISDSVLSTKPASGIGYIEQKMSSFKLIPEAKAQQAGFGFRSLEPIQDIWRATRNASYFLLILVFIAMAFMVMFRVKISPQAVITIQSAIPKLAVILILTTFSFAIAGLLIDLSYVLVGLVALILKTAGNDVTSLDLLPLFNKLSSGTNIVGGDQFLGPLGSLFVMLIVIGVLIAGVGALAGAATFGVTFGIGTIVLLIFFALVFFTALRILWLLLRTFVTLIVTIIIGPIMILMGALPGVGGFRAWLQTLLANIAVFPTVLIMVFLAHFLFWKFLPARLTVGSASTPFGEALGALEFLNPYKIPVSPGAGSPSIGLPGFSMTPILASVFGAFGTLLLIPAAGNIVKSLVQGKPFDFGGAIGAAVGAPLAVGQGRLGANVAAIEKGEAEAAAAAGRPYIQSRRVAFLKGTGLVKGR